MDHLTGGCVSQLHCQKLGIAPCRKERRCEECHDERFVHGFVTRLLYEHAGRYTESFVQCPNHSYAEWALVIQYF